MEKPIKIDGSGRNSRYNVGVNTYPLDLFSNGANQFGKSWVLFNINVQENSNQVKPDQTIDMSALTEAEKSKRSMAQSENRVAPTEHGFATLTTAGAAVGGLMAALKEMKTNGENASLTSVGINSTVGALKTGVAAAVVATPLLFAGSTGRPTKRLKEAIQLPMPSDFSTNYGLNWGEHSALMFDMMMRAPQLVGEIGKISSDADALSRIGTLGKDALMGASLGIMKGANADSISTATGFASNPKKEMSFQGVDFRTFSMDYVFFPKSAEETESIKNIIQLFKFHMHPEYYSSNRFTFIYPSEFDITFFAGDGVENQYVSRIATCILTNMIVNYTPDGVWAPHEGGAPSAVRITLSFKELGIQTKESIKEGF